MQDNTLNNKKSKGSRGVFIVWFAMAALVLLVLVSSFTLIWRARSEVQTQDHCMVMADAVLKQTILNEERITDAERVLSENDLLLNALAGWCWNWVGEDWEQYGGLGGYAFYSSDAIAILGDEQYQVLRGEFPRKEFDTVVKKEQELIDSAEDEDLNYNCNQVTSGDKNYAFAYFPMTETTVISRLTDQEVERDNDLFYEVSNPMPEGALILVNLNDNSVIQVLGDIGIKEGDILGETIDDTGTLQIGDDMYFAGSSENERFRVFALYPKGGSASYSVISPIAATLLFFILFVLTLLFAWFLREDVLRGRVEKDWQKDMAREIAVSMRKHVRIVYFMGCALVIVLIVLICTFFMTDGRRIWGKGILSSIEMFYEKDDEDVYFQSELRRSLDMTVARTISDILNEVPEDARTPSLSDLDSAIARGIFVMNRNGKVINASRDEYDFTGLDNPDSQWHELATVLSGQANEKEIVITNDSFSLISYAERIEDKDLVVVVVNSHNKETVDYEFYADYKMPSGMSLYAVDIKEDRILSCSLEGYSGLNASSIGLKGSVLNDNYSGNIILNGRFSFVLTNANKNRASLIAVDLGYLTGQYLGAMLIIIIIGFIVTSMSLFLIFRMQRRVWEDIQLPERAASKSSEPDDGNSEKEEETAEFYNESRVGLRPNRSAVGRWLRHEMPFQRRSADEKLFVLIHILVIIMLIAAFTVYRYSSRAGIAGSSVAFLLQHTWDRGLNIYAVSYTMFVFVGIFAVSLILRRIIMLIGEYMGNRGETIARLIGSFISYAAALGAIGYGLMFLGVNTTTILASAGIIGLGVSIGAKDLVSDVLSGISIVFEGEFRTGDIVEIGGYRGEVQEIGIRTTKVTSRGNVKVFRNSDVSGVINFTQRYSIAEAELNVNRLESYEKLEEIFTNALPGIGRRIPQAVEPIRLCGISSLKDYCYVLLFQTKCRESDRIAVERLLRKELSVLMEKKNLAPLAPIKTPSVRESTEQSSDK